MADSTVTRRRTLPTRERQICARLRVIRETVNLTQQQLADQLGLTRQRLASYEEQRVAIRYDVGIRLCRHLVVSELWLATGRGEPRQHLGLTVEMVPRSMSINALYSEAFDAILEPIYQTRLVKYPDSALVTVGPGEPPGVVENLFYQCLAIWKARISKEAREVLFQNLIGHGTELLTKNVDKFEAHFAEERSVHPHDNLVTVYEIRINKLPSFGLVRQEA